LDWSKIKSIFIVTFLILNIYLTYEILKTLQMNEYEVQTETTFEKRLIADEIKFKGELPTNYTEDSYLKAKPKVFTSEDIKNKIFDNQTIKIQSSGIELSSTLDEPIEIKEKFDPAELTDFIRNHVLYGDQYRFWEKSKDGNTITYYQKFEDKTLFQNSKGKLTFLLNEENDEIVQYNQTFLEGIEVLSEPEKIIQPIKAIETLYNSDALPPKSEITKVSLGYYTLIPLDDTTQVLNPAWRFVINDKENLYVSAFEGKIIELTEEKKIVE
jgi:regulatory protein YycI of two-component signal transduction system YycFG